MKKKRRIIIGMICVVVLIIMGNFWIKRNKEEDSNYKIYYINAKGTSIVEKNYFGEMEYADVALENLLLALKESPDVKLQAAIPAEVEVEDYTLEYGKICLYFNEAYKKLNPVQEVLTRAAVVRSLTQIPNVNEVMFYVDDTPLTSRDGKAYGYMKAADFVQNTGSSINYYVVTEFEVSFSDRSGKHLVKEVQDVRFNSSQMRESVVVECLIKGPESSEAIATLPKGTELLNASIKDGICYLNFNEALNTSMQGVKPETIIYAIVNSVIDCGNVGMVQIAINGETNLTYQECISLHKPLGRNLDILEE